MRKLLGVFAVGAMLVAGTANAAPVATGAILGVSIQGLAPITTAGPGGSVDVTGTTITVPAGLVTLGASLTIPVTGVSAINSLVVTKLSNLSATFSVGGVTAQGPGEVCPGGGPAGNTGCNTGGGLGGSMALTGTVFVHVVPHVLVIPVNLNKAKIGQGGPGGGTFTTEAALWSTGPGLVNTGNNVFTTTGTGSPVTLVSGTFLSAVGNVLPVFTTFTLTNITVPEPGTLLLIGSGLAGLVLLGRRRS